jgi:type I restriction enzyme S subunit
MVAVRADPKKIYPLYLFALLRSPEVQTRIGNMHVGTLIPHFKKGDFDKLILPVPDQKSQHLIGDTYFELSQKIESNCRMGATLEAMARAVFKSWFVDFDPVRRNSEGGESRPEDSLFPDAFEDSAIGQIPTGWEVMSLYETATYRNGAPFKPADFCPNEDGLPVVKIAELKSGLSDQTKWSTKQLGSDQMIDTGDLLYSWSGSPDTSLDAFLWSNGPGLVNQHIFKVITSSDAEKRFVYYLLKHLRPVLVETARDKQTTGLGHVTVADMKRLQVCRPPKDILAAFDRLITPIFDKAFANTVESQTLATLRDTLLPRLLDGSVTAKPQ